MQGDPSPWQAARPAKSQREPLPDIVEARSTRAAWLLQSVWIFLGVCCIGLVWNGSAGTTVTKIYWTVGLAGIFVAGMTLTAISILRVRYVADLEGFSWRSLFREKRVMRSQIRAYYSVTTKDSKSFVVETSLGRVSFDATFVCNAGLLRAAIAERSIGATTREWAPEGAALALGEKKTFELDKTIVSVFKVCSLLAVTFVFCMASSLGGSLCTPLALGTCKPGPVLTFDFKSFFPFALYAPIFAVIFPLMSKQLRYVRDRAESRLTISEEDIIWFDGRQTIQSGWRGVESISLDAEKAFIEARHFLTIRTTNGTKVLMPSYLKNDGIISVLLDRYVPANVIRSKTGADVQRPIQPPGGSLRYNYRNRLASAMIGGFTACAVQVPALTALRIANVIPPSGDTASQFDWFTACILVSLLLLLGYTWRSYLYSSVTIGSHNLELRSLCGTRTVPLTDLVALTVGSHYFKLETKDQTFWLSPFLTDFDGFKRELRTRVPRLEAG